MKFLKFIVLPFLLCNCEYKKEMEVKKSETKLFSVNDVENFTYPYTLPALPYPYGALEPYVDELTMKIHHDKHHQAYIDNLNKALESHPELQNKTLGELLKDTESLPEDVKKTIINNGGGHFNHTIFWFMMGQNTTKIPTDLILDAINKNFGSFEKFKEEFIKAAKTVFGSGWAWLCLDKNKNLKIISSPNQDSPISQGLFPILGLDVWEHAYYLKYQNKRPDYIDAWWNVLNWNYVEENYKKYVE